MGYLDVGIHVIDSKVLRRANELVEAWCIIDGEVDFEKSNINDNKIFFNTTEEARKNNLEYKVIKIPDVDTDYLITNGKVNLGLMNEYEKRMPTYKDKPLAEIIKIIPINTDSKILEDGKQSTLERRINS